MIRHSLGSHKGRKPKYREQHLQRYGYMNQHGILKKPWLKFECIWVKGKDFRENKSFEYHLQELGAHLLGNEDLLQDVKQSQMILKQEN